MGKKPEKTKEISVAIAEASSAEGRHETETHNQIPRKRGRPRKIIIISEKRENQVASEVEDPVGQDFEKSDQYSKKVKISDQQVEQEEEVEVEEEEEQRTEHRLKQQGSSASRGILSRSSRRKSRPRKSS